MAVTAWKFAQLAAEDTSAGSNNWVTNAGGVLVGTELSSDDAAYAQALWGDAITSYWLVGKNFSFASEVPSGATIDGIEARFSRFRDGSATITNTQVKLVKASVIVGNNLGNTTNWPTSEGLYTVGGATELGGVGWSRSDIIDSGFGIALAVTYQSDLFGPQYGAYVDSLEMRIHYTAGSAPVIRKRPIIIMH
jgi:hypothetical protein